MDAGELSLGRLRVVRFAVLAAVCVLSLAAGPAHASGPKPGTPEYFQRDNQNMQDAYGRELAPGGQVNNTNYTQAIVTQHGETWWRQLGQQLAIPNRIAITPGNFFPGWNGGNPLRGGWAGRRGMMVPVSYTNRYGALIRSADAVQIDSAWSVTHPWRRSNTNVQRCVNARGASASPLRTSPVRRSSSQMRATNAR